MIKEIKWKNHEILGNLKLNFDHKGPVKGPYSTIVFAGENGSGKTTILETLFNFLNGGSIVPFDYIRHSTAYKLFKITPRGPNQDHGSHTRINESDHTSKSIMAVTNSKDDVYDIRNYGLAYLEAKSEFNPEKITSTKTNTLDQKKKEREPRSSSTSTKQLLVDIHSQDMSELDLVMKNSKNRDEDYDKFNQNSRISRFEKAFNNFFENIKFSIINTTKSGEIEIFFEKNNKKFSIDTLSCGEKQIVFRGTYLLKNVKLMDNATVLIDEPELSMHPKWQRKILAYYKDLFEKNGIQSAQMFFSTHSEEVIKSALGMQNTIVIVLKEENGEITPKYVTEKEFVISPLSAAEVNYVAFGIPSSDLHLQLYVYLQSKLGYQESVKQFDTYIKEFLETHKLPSNEYLKEYRYKNRRTGKECVYDTLPSHIRNWYVHDDHGYPRPTDEDLKKSIDFLITMHNTLKKEKKFPQAT